VKSKSIKTPHKPKPSKAAYTKWKLLAKAAKAADIADNKSCIANNKTSAALNKAVQLEYEAEGEYYALKEEEEEMKSGWMTGTVQDFLGLSDKEVKEVEMKVKEIKKTRSK